MQDQTLGVNRKRICNFLIVINSNFGRIYYRFRNMTFKAIENGLFFLPLPCLTPPLEGTCKNFWMRLTLQKLEWWGYKMVKISWS